MKNLAQNLKRGRGLGLSLAVIAFFYITNAKAQSTPVDTLVNATGGTMKFLTEERLGNIDSGKTIMREIYLYLGSDTTYFSFPVKTTWESKTGKKLDSVTVVQPGKYWVRIKVTDTSTGKYSWSRMQVIDITPVAKKGSIIWVSKPQNLNDTVSMQFAYTSNVDGKAKVYKGLTSGQLYLSKVINVKADTIGKSLFDFYKVPSGIETFYRIDFENAFGTVSTTVEKATAAPTKRTPLVRVDSVWSDGLTLKIKGFVNAFGSKTGVWIRYGLTSNASDTSSRVWYEGYSNQQFTIAIPNRNYGEKLYYEANSENTVGKAKDIQGYYVMPTKPAKFEIVVTKVTGNFGTVTVEYTVYLAPNSTARVGLYRDNNSDMSSPEAQLDLETISQTGQIIRTFENVPVGDWNYAGWGNDTKGTIIDHGNVILHKMKWGTSIKHISLITETVNASVYDVNGRFIGIFKFSNSDYSQLPKNQIIIVDYIDEKGQRYADKITVSE